MKQQMSQNGDCFVPWTKHQESLVKFYGEKLFKQENLQPCDRRLPFQEALSTHANEHIRADFSIREIEEPQIGAWH